MSERASEPGIADSTEQHQGKAALEDALATTRKSEEHFRKMLATIPTLAWCTRADGYAEYYSQRWYEYTGLPFEEAKGHGWTAAIHPDDLKNICDRWQEIIASEKPGDVEARFRRHDGEYRWHLFRAAPHFDDEGRLANWYGTNTDIEDLKRAEQELRRSKVCLEHAQRLSHTGSVGNRLPEGKLFWSEETARIYGYDPGIPLTQEMVLSRTHPDDLPLLQEVFRRAAEGNTSFDFQHRLLMPDGSIKYLRSYADSVVDDSGCEEILGAVTDITEQTLSKIALEDALARARKSEAEFRAIVEAIPTHVWCALPDGSTEFQNQRWLDYAGLTPEQARSWGWSDALHPDDLDEYVRRWLRIMESRELGESEARFRRFDGEYRWYLMRAVPVWDEQGKISKWYGTNTDIDDLKRAETFLAGEKRLFEMIATGHPLQAILDVLCRIVEELAEGSIASILLLDEDGKRLRHEAAPSLPESYTKATDDVLIGPSVGSCGTAAYRGEKVFVSDIATNPLWADYKKLALHHDLRACFSTPIFSSEGKVLGTFAVYAKRAREMTPRESRITEQFTHLASIIIERKRAESALRESEATLAEGQRISHTGSWRWSADTGRVVWSEECARLYGFSPEERIVTHTAVLERVLPEDRALVDAIEAQAKRGDGAFEFEQRIVLPDGSIRLIHNIGRPALTEPGAGIEYVGTVRDITEQRKREEETRRLVSLIENSNDFIAYARSPREILYMNGAWRRLAGLAADEDLSPYEIANFLPANEYRHFLEEVLPILEREGHWEGERSLLHTKTKAVTPVHQTIFFLTEAGTNRRSAMATICRDVTERRRADEELRRSEADLRKAQAELAHVTRVTTMGELAASIAHEVNQPIAGVVLNGNACLRWLAREKGDSANLAQAREAVGRIIRDGTRAGEVITRIRALFRKTETTKEPLDLGELIREVIVLARSEMDKRRVALRLKLADDLPRILGDRVQLQQVMLNLILNGIEAMSAIEERPRELTITTGDYDGANVLVSVRDTGTGLDSASEERIFAAFHTTKPGGLGMGLSISRSIVENHSGKLWATAHDGPGATFQFTLPKHPPGLP